MSETTIPADFWKVTLQLRVRRTDQPTWMQQGLATKFADFNQAEDFVRKVAQWADAPVLTVASIRWRAR